MRAQQIVDLTCATGIALIAVVAIPMAAQSEQTHPEIVVVEATPIEEDRAIILDSAGDTDVVGEVQILDPVAEVAPVAEAPVVPDDDSFAGNDAHDPNRGAAGYVQAEDGSWVPETFYAAAEEIHEDDARWDCRTMGNRTCGVEIEGAWYVVTFDEAGLPVLVAQR